MQAKFRSEQGNTMVSYTEWPITIWLTIGNPRNKWDRQWVGSLTPTHPDITVDLPANWLAVPCE